MPIKLTDADEEILDLLEEGARTQGYLVDETGMSRQHVHNRLKILLAGDYLKLIHESTALYEIREDPRDATKT